MANKALEVWPLPPSLTSSLSTLLLALCPRLTGLWLPLEHSNVSSL